MSGLLDDIKTLCKGSVIVTINDHKTYYLTVGDYFLDKDMRDIDSVIFAMMIAKDTIVHVQAYPDTPVGFFEAYHFNINGALEEIYSAILEDRKINPLRCDS